MPRPQKAKKKKETSVKKTALRRAVSRVPAKARQVKMVKKSAKKATGAGSRVRIFRALSRARAHKEMKKGKKKEKGTFRRSPGGPKEKQTGVSVRTARTAG